MAGRIYVGTAGWSIPRASAPHCPASGTHLQRYAQVFDCAEINSSFYRSHGPATYARWAGSTNADFRFSVKVPRTITHEQKLRRARVPLERFLSETNGLGPHRGVLLVQLPPSLSFEARVAATFFRLLRSCYDGSVACEPRHPSWFDAAATDALRRYEIARVASDPPPVPQTSEPDGWMDPAYFRLHGSPRMYWSRYDADYVTRLASKVRRIAERSDVWCVFDNTASGAALENAWELRHLLSTPAEREDELAGDACRHAS
jgi:uncharacterized protein YecE (DUF72 family)